MEITFMLAQQREIYDDFANMYFIFGIRTIMIT